MTEGNPVVIKSTWRVGREERGSALSYLNRGIEHHEFSTNHHAAEESWVCSIISVSYHPYLKLNGCGYGIGIHSGTDRCLKALPCDSSRASCARRRQGRSFSRGCPMCRYKMPTEIDADCSRNACYAPSGLTLLRHSSGGLAVRSVAGVTVRAEPTGGGGVLDTLTAGARRAFRGFKSIFRRGGRTRRSPAVAVDNRVGSGTPQQDGGFGALWVDWNNNNNNSFYYCSSMYAVNCVCNSSFWRMLNFYVRSSCEWIFLTFGCDLRETL